MTDLVHEVWRQWKATGETRVLVGVSGGADSVALLRLLVAACELGGRDPKEWLVVGHLHHGLRPSAQEDLAFVTALAAELRLPCEAKTLDEAIAEWVRTGTGDAPDWIEGSDHGGLQARARSVRWASLEAWSARHRCELIAVAHHQEDQAETTLLRLLRGTGLTGAAGMRSRGPGARWRPLLGIPRSDLRSFLEAGEFPWREDPSNEDPRFERVRVRDQLLPALESVRGGAVRNLARFAARAAEDDDALTTLAQRLLEGAVETLEDQGVEIDSQVFRDQPHALVLRCLRDLRRRVTGTATDHTQLEELGELVAEKRSGLVALGEGGAWLHRGKLRLRPRVEDPWLPEEGRLIPEGEWLEAPALGMAVRVASSGARLRHPRPGDRFRPRGLRGGSARLGRYLRDRGLDRTERSRVAVLDYEGELLWVLGHEPAWEIEAGPVRIEVCEA